MTMLNAQTREADSLILVDIYQNLDGENWTNPENWLTDTPLDDWKGVNLQNDRVVTLEIIQQNAVGEFPTEILDLDKLSTFEIRQATISGEIPENITELADLKRFVLNNTGIGGEIPNVWTNFENLQTLVFAFNNLTGTLPDIGDDLTLLSFQGNKLTGPIPNSWMNNPLPNLTLDGNELTGNFDILSTFPNLIKIDLDNNDWDPAPFPSWVDDNQNLDRFSCNRCNLTGPLPEDLNFKNHDFYSGMFLTNNELTGDVSLLFNAEDSPSDLYLNVGFNKFSGEFPADKIRAFSRVILQGNDYSSITPFTDGLVLNTFNMKSNLFTFESLDPIKEYVVIDSDIPVDYESQEKLLTIDTFQIDEPTVLTFEAGDAHPMTTYQWYKSNQPIDGAMERTFVLDIQDFSANGSYYCKMNNADFPDLELDRNTIVVKVDLTFSSTSEIPSRTTFFPNPTKDLLHLKTIDKGQTHYRLFNSIGYELVNGTFNEQYSISLGNQLPGVYFLQLQFENQIQTIKILKE